MNQPYRELTRWLLWMMQISLYGSTFLALLNSTQEAHKFLPPPPSFLLPFPPPLCLHLIKVPFLLNYCSSLSPVLLKGAFQGGQRISKSLTALLNIDHNRVPWAPIPTWGEEEGGLQERRMETRSLWQALSQNEEVKEQRMSHPST